MSVAIIKPDGFGRKLAVMQPGDQRDPQSILDRHVLKYVAHIDLVELTCRKLPAVLQTKKARRSVTAVYVTFDGKSFGRWHIKLRGGDELSPVDRIDALQWLAKLQVRSFNWGDERLYLYRYEIALELITEDKATAWLVHTHVRRWVRLKWPGKSKVGKSFSTAYLADDPERDRNIAMYSDRLSKVEGKPACRVEIRLKGDSGRRIVPNLEQLLECNPQLIFRRCVQDGPLGFIEHMPQKHQWPGLFW